MKRGLQALGRLKVGTMNKTDAAYAATLDQRRIAGEVAWFKFEGVKLRLGDNTFYTPDFFVMLTDGTLEAHEVKGFWQDDARVKIKVAADLYPFRFLAIQPGLKRVAQTGKLKCSDVMLCTVLDSFHCIYRMAEL